MHDAGLISFSLCLIFIFGWGIWDAIKDDKNE
jgi:hypothetical protein